MSSLAEEELKELLAGNPGDESEMNLKEEEEILHELEGGSHGDDHVGMSDPATSETVESVSLTIEDVQAKLAEIEEESKKIQDINSEMDQQLSANNAHVMTLEEKMEVDGRSIYVGNVDYSATADDLERHFHGCGSINRVTILTDKFSGQPKGFAYVEFAEKESVETAQVMDDSLFKGRQIKVNPKRTNRPGLGPNTFRGRGGRARGRGYARGGYYGGGRIMRGRGGRGRGWFSPY